jgi:hypothetical protein
MHVPADSKFTVKMGSEVKVSGGAELLPCANSVKWATLIGPVKVDGETGYVVIETNEGKKTTVCRVLNMLLGNPMKQSSRVNSW